MKQIDKFLRANFIAVAALYILLDIFFAGMGMGVPVLCILFGFPVGWYATKRITEAVPNRRSADRKILSVAAWTSGFTFLQMLVIWIPAAGMLFNPASDYANFGHPFILYEPKASFIAWLVLMILISPFLQVLVTVFSSFITMAWTRTKQAVEGA